MSWSRTAAPWLTNTILSWAASAASLLVVATEVSSWLPTLQGWHLEDYLRHEAMHRDAGIDLTQAPFIRAGSVCKSGSSAKIAAIFTTSAAT